MLLLLFLRCRWPIQEKDAMKSFLQRYRETFAGDVRAGLVVFLVALPLCLGIALASGAPLMAGLLAGIVGGTVIALLSGSQVSVSGPAAGLTVIVLGALATLGGDFRVFQMAVVIAGLIQLAMGFLRVSVIAHYIPSSVINGMLTAIGISIIFQQLPYALGLTKADLQGEGAELALPHMLASIGGQLGTLNPGVVVISLLSLAVLVGWGRLPSAALRSVPGPVVVVVLGILLHLGFQSLAPALALAPSQLVALPVIQHPLDFARSLSAPDFSALGRQEVWLIGVTIALVASLETLLCIEASDQLDPLQRRSDGNRELCAQGVGNAVSGMIGGLPITSVIVRTSVNINSGGRSRMSALVHGVLLLVAVLALPRLLNLIPLAALAMILIVTGCKLIGVQRIRQIVRVGWNQSIPFVATVLAILATDLLEGIAIGMVVGIALLLFEHYRLSHSFEVERDVPTKQARIVLAEHVSFLNKARLVQTLEAFPAGSTVEIDGSRSRAVDHDVLVAIRHFCDVVAPRQGVRVLLTQVPEPAAAVEAH